MRFPIANVSYEWNPKEDYTHYILMDPYVYTNNEQILNEFYLNQKFVDSEGNIYRIVDKRLPTSWWRKAFHFLPDVYRVTLLFYKTVDKMDLEQVRSFVHKQVSKKAEDTTKWLGHIKKAKTIQEILGGE